MKTLVFLYNNLLDEEYQRKLRLPLEFISFGYIEKALMYEVEGQHMAIPINTIANHKKYDKIYGALYILDSSEIFLRMLDASLICSKGLIGLNHKMDKFHRMSVNATPIQFKSVEDFLKLKYNEGEPIRVITYLGNPNNEVIKAKVKNKTQNRVTCGFDINNFINLVMKEKQL